MHPIAFGDRFFADEGRFPLNTDRFLSRSGGFVGRSSKMSVMGTTGMIFSGLNTKH
jgi:hypothetical protein